MHHIPLTLLILCPMFVGCELVEGFDTNNTQPGSPGPFVPSPSIEGHGSGFGAERGPGIAVLATGGSDTLLHVRANIFSSSFDVERIDSETSLITAPIEAAEGTLRAGSTAASAATYDLIARPVTEVRLEPSTPWFRFANPGQPFGIRNNDRFVFIALINRSADGVETGLLDYSMNLVDGTSPSVAQARWDRIQVSTARESSDIVVEADSFSRRAFTVRVVDEIDALEGEVIELDEEANDATVCFHAFSDGLEIAAVPTSFSFERARKDLDFANCVNVTLEDGPEAATVSASLLGIDATVTVREASE